MVDLRVHSTTQFAPIRKEVAGTRLCEFVGGARSSAGRALRSQCRGREFDPRRVHQLSLTIHAKVSVSPKRRRRVGGPPVIIQIRTYLTQRLGGAERTAQRRFQRVDLVWISHRHFSPAYRSEIACYVSVRLSERRLANSPQARRNRPISRVKPHKRTWSAGCTHDTVPAMSEPATAYASLSATGYADGLGRRSL